MQTWNISTDALPWAVTFPAKAIDAWLLLSGWDTRWPEPNELLCFFIKGLSEDDISHWDHETILPGVCHFQIEEKTCIKGMGCDWFSCSQLEVLCQTATVNWIRIELNKQWRFQVVWRWSLEDTEGETGSVTPEEIKGKCVKKKRERERKQEDKVKLVFS